MGKRNTYMQNQAAFVTLYPFTVTVPRHWRNIIMIIETSNLYRLNLPRLLACCLCCMLYCLVVTQPAWAERETVLKQIDVPHNYYFREMYLPQLTSGPSSLAWSPDGETLVYSMQGSLWVQATDSATARQLTAGPGYDYQPDWSRDGKFIVFARYLDDAVELYRLDLDSGLTIPPHLGQGRQRRAALVARWQTPGLGFHPGQRALSYPHRRMG